jgi:hypothetical protein
MKIKAGNLVRGRWREKQEMGRWGDGRKGD